MYIRRLYRCIGLANSDLTGWPDDCACALPCGEASSNLSDGESDKGRSEAAAFRSYPLA
jgi:hypothetical protein